MHLSILSRNHFLFPRAEQLIETVFAREYGATISHLPDRILAVFDGAYTPICAAGLRDAASGLFSECYLDLPIEAAVEQATGETIARAEILELTALAADRPGATAILLRGFAQIGLDAGYRWGLFTATQRLRTMTRRLGIDLIGLTDARRDRAPDPESWGSYYDQKPRVCIVDGRLAQDRLNRGRLAGGGFQGGGFNSTINSTINSSVAA